MVYTSSQILKLNNTRAWPQKPGSGTIPFFCVQVNTIVIVICMVYGRSSLMKTDRKFKVNVVDSFELQFCGYISGDDCSG